MNNNYYIDNITNFNKFIEKAKKQKLVAVDTEFYWRETYSPILCLVQIAFSKEEFFIIDTLAIKDISALGDVLSNNNIVKIFHDPLQDLQILSNICAPLNPINIFDTRHAAGFAGLKHTISLADLIQELIGVKLPKTETYTNWTKRPLTDKQIEYAIDDVIYMFDIYNILIERSHKNGLGKWLNDEMKIYDNIELYKEHSPDERFLRIKGIKRLTLLQLKLTKYLALWREEEAKIRDIPKTFIFRDKILMKIIRSNPHNIQDLKNLHLLSNETLDDFGEEIINILKTAKLSDDNLESIHKHLRLRISGNKLKSLKQFVATKAKEYNLPPELIATRGDLVILLEDKKRDNLANNQLLRTWRSHILSSIITEV